MRVNVLNQPYAAFDWLNLPQRANTNWYNAHNFYGDLADIEAATVGNVKTFFDTYYVPNNAVLMVVGDVATDAVFADGGAFNSRIVRNIREQKGYTYSPRSQFSAFLDAGFYQFAADVRNEVTGPTLKEVFLEIDKMQAEGSDGAELEAAKQYYKGIFVLQNATQAGLAAAINNQYVFGLPKDYVESFQSRIEAVGAPQVKAAAQALLGSEHTVIVIMGDYSKVKDQLAGYKEIEFYDVTGKKLPAPPTSQ